MKTKAKILTLLLILSILVCGIVLAASADAGETTATTKIQTANTTVTIDPASSEKDNSWVAYADEEAFLSDIDNGLIDGKDAEGNPLWKHYRTSDNANFGKGTTIAYHSVDNEQGAGYFYVLKDGVVFKDSTDGSDDGIFKFDYNAIFNFGGKTVKVVNNSQTSLSMRAYKNVAFVNGGLCSQTSGDFELWAVQNSTLCFENVTLSTTKSQANGLPFISLSGGCDIVFNNVTSNLTSTQQPKGLVRIDPNLPTVNDPVCTCAKHTNSVEAATNDITMKNVNLGNAELFTVRDRACEGGYKNLVHANISIDENSSYAGSKIFIEAAQRFEGSNVNLDIPDDWFFSIEAYDKNGKLFNASGDLTPTFIKTIPAGAYVEILSDVTLSGGNLKDNYATGITFDLNGHAITAAATNARWYPHKSADGVVTIKNGTYNFTDTVVIDGGANYGVVKFVDVDFRTDAHPYVFQLVAGNVELYGGSYYTSDETDESYIFFIGHKAIATSASAKVYGTNFKSNNTFACVNPTNKDAATERILEIGSYNGAPTVIQTNVFLVVPAEDGTYTWHENSKVTVNVKDAYIQCAETIKEGASNIASNNYSYTFENVYLRSDIETVQGKLTTKGKKLNVSASVGEDTAHFNVAYITEPKIGSFKGNLTLESDITLTFRIPTDTEIAAIKANGVEIFNSKNVASYEVYNNCYEIKVGSFLPNNAATYVALEISYDASTTIKLFDTEAGKAVDTAVSITNTANGNYSVIHYASTLFDDTTMAPEVESASENAMKAMLVYIDAAYAHFAENEDTKSDDAVKDILDRLIEENGAADYVAGFTPAIHENNTELAGVTAAFRVDTVTKLYIKADGNVTLKNSNGSIVALDASDVAEYDYMVEFRAYALCDVYTITTDSGSATFSFGEYIVDLGAESGTSLDAILKAMYAYGSAANALKTALVGGGLIEQ